MFSRRVNDPTPGVKADAERGRKTDPDRSHRTLPIDEVNVGPLARCWSY
jgi:hypothetical protein